MRYFKVDGTYVPKHCKFGPRPNEGAVITHEDWWRINEHLTRSQRDQDNAIAKVAKEEAKKQASFEMTRSWENTLTSAKTSGEQKRLENIEKDKQDKIDKYNEIMKNKKLEQQKVMMEAKKILYQAKDMAKPITSSLLFSAVIQEREKQIELKNILKMADDRREQLYADKVKKMDEDFWKEQRLKQSQKVEQKKYLKKFLEDQIEYIRKREADEIGMIDVEQQDLQRMSLEMKKIDDHALQEKIRAREKCKSLCGVRPEDIAFKKKLELEDEEENGINQIYVEFARRFEKGRRDKLKETMEESMAEKDKMRVKLAQEKKDKSDAEKAWLEEVARKKEQEILKKIAEEAVIKRKKIAEIKEAKKEADERIAHEKKIEKEAMKWEVVQRFKREEINDSWRQAGKLHREEVKKVMREMFLDQMKQNADRRAKQKEEMEAPLEDIAAENEELLAFLDQALEYTKEKGRPIYPVLAAIARVKKENGLQKPTERAALNPDVEKQHLRLWKKPKEGNIGGPAYCFRN